MKTILTLSVGFWLGRQLYINYDKKEALKREVQVKKRLVDFLETNRFSKSDTTKYVTKIIG